MVASSPSFGEHCAEEWIHANPLKRLFSPRAGQTITVKYDAAGAPVGVSLYGAVRSLGVHKPTFEAVAMNYDASASSIAVVVNEDSQDATIPLEFTFIYRPDQGFAPIHKDTGSQSRRSIGASGLIRTRCYLKELTCMMSLLAPR